MIVGERLSFIKDYVSSINDAIKQQSPEKSLNAAAILLAILCNTRIASDQ